MIAAALVIVLLIACGAECRAPADSPHAKYQHVFDAANDYRNPQSLINPSSELASTHEQSEWITSHRHAFDVDTDTVLLAASERVLRASAGPGATTPAGPAPTKPRRRPGGWPRNGAGGAAAGPNTGSGASSLDPNAPLYEVHPAATQPVTGIRDDALDSSGEFEGVTAAAAAARGASPTRNAIIIEHKIGTSVRARVSGSEHRVTGNIAYLHNPLHHWSVYEPLNGGCAAKKTSRLTATARAREHECLFATNGGYFHTKTNECLGNVVSDGVIRVRSKRQNVHFGLTKAGEYVVGYLPGVDDRTAELTRDGKNGLPVDTPVTWPWEFDQLLAGVLWLVRNGTNYVSESLLHENMKTQTTGNDFADVVSARTAIGHTKSGELIQMTVEGKTWKNGVDLYGFADLLIKMGAWNAINLDGGGSATVAINGGLANFPSDECGANKLLSCERPIVTIACMHHDRREELAAERRRGGTGGAAADRVRFTESESGTRTSEHASGSDLDRSNCSRDFDLVPASAVDDAVSGWRTCALIFVPTTAVCIILSIYWYCTARNPREWRGGYSSVNSDGNSEVPFPDLPNGRRRGGAGGAAAGGVISSGSIVPTMDVLASDGNESDLDDGRTRTDLLDAPIDLEAEMSDSTPTNSGAAAAAARARGSSASDASASGAAGMAAVAARIKKISTAGSAITIPQRSSALIAPPPVASTAATTVTATATAAISNASTAPLISTVTTPAAAPTAAILTTGAAASGAVTSVLPAHVPTELLE